MGPAAGFKAETLAPFEANPCGIYGVQIAIGTGYYFIQSTAVFPCRYYSINASFPLTIHSSIIDAI
jgi:hypothetical protein